MSSNILMHMQSMAQSLQQQDKQNEMLTELTFAFALEHIPQLEIIEIIIIIIIS